MVAPNRIQQVLLNLLNNAIKFTGAGSVTLKVRVDDSVLGEARLRFSVIDSGMGIPEDKQGRLFERFSQADASISRDYGGTGLGLAICKRLVELMDGEIGVFSHESQGSNFWFTLALKAAEAAAPVSAPTRVKPTRQGRLLLVEDIEVNQVLARAMLEGDGHTVDVVGCGEDAIAAVRAGRYDLVLMDVQMPGMGGLVAARSIRALPDCAIPTIVALTANVMTEHVNACRAAGFSDHVRKPIIRADLRTVLDRWLDRRCAPDASSAQGEMPFDAAIFEQVAAMLGPAKTIDTLTSFEAELEGRLSSGDVEPSRRTLFMGDAHVITAVAGMTGFNELARSCSEIATFGADRADEFVEAAARVLCAKEATLVTLARLRRLCDVARDGPVHQGPARPDAAALSTSLHWAPAHPGRSRYRDTPAEAEMCSRLRFAGTAGRRRERSGASPCPKLPDATVSCERTVPKGIPQEPR